MKPQVVHLKNVYPGGRVDWSENHADAYDAAGNLRVALRKDGAGMIRDVGREHGASDEFSLDPIPKNARVHKLHNDGRIGLDEKHVERKAAAKAMADDSGKVESIKYFQDNGIEFDPAGNLIFPKKAPGDVKASTQEPPVTPVGDSNQSQQQ